MGGGGPWNERRRLKQHSLNRRRLRTVGQGALPSLNGDGGGGGVVDADDAKIHGRGEKAKHATQQQQQQQQHRVHPREHDAPQWRRPDAAPVRTTKRKRFRVGDIFKVLCALYAALFLGGFIYIERALVLEGGGGSVIIDDEDEFVLWRRQQTYITDCQKHMLRNDTWGEERAPYTDKIAVKNIIRQWIEEDEELKSLGLKIPETYAVFEKSNRTLFSLEMLRNLPQPYIMKRRQGSGAHILYYSAQHAECNMHNILCYGRVGVCCFSPVSVYSISTLW